MSRAVSSDQSDIFVSIMAKAAFVVCAAKGCLNSRGNSELSWFYQNFLLSQESRQVWSVNIIIIIMMMWCDESQSRYCLSVNVRYMCHCHTFSPSLSVFPKVPGQGGSTFFSRSPILMNFFIYFGNLFLQLFKKYFLIFFRPLGLWRHIWRNNIFF